MPRTKRTGRANKWASLEEIDFRTKVGSPAWEARHPRWQVRKLSAWRRMHKIFNGHPGVKVAAIYRGVGSPSSQMPLRQMVSICKKHG